LDRFRAGSAVKRVHRKSQARVPVPQKSPRARVIGTRKAHRETRGGTGIGNTSRAFRQKFYSAAEGGSTPANAKNAFAGDPGSAVHGSR